MNKYLASCLALTFTSLLSPSASAEEFLPPYAETPFSEQVHDRLSDEVLPNGNWAFDVTVFNPNNREVYCKNTPFLARLSLADTLCIQPDYASYVYPAGDGKGFMVPANGSIEMLEAGYNERQAKNTSTNQSLEFCGREGWALDCGYPCPNGKVLGEIWEEKINESGVKKFTCQRDGTSGLLEVRCDSEHSAGTTWSMKDGEGTRHFACQASGEITNDLRCDQTNLQIVKDDKCVPAPCEGIFPHGERYTTLEMDFGKKTGLCSFGYPIDKVTECNPDAIKVGESCRLANNCVGNVKHGSFTSDSPQFCPASCTKIQTQYQCQDGNLIKGESKEISCRPARGRCA